MIPKLSSASVVWWHRFNVIAKEKILDHLQAMVHRSMVGAPNNSIKTLRIIWGSPPSHIVIKESAAWTAASLRALGKWIPGWDMRAKVAELFCLELLNIGLGRTAWEIIIIEKRKMGELHSFGAVLYKSLVHGWFKIGWEYWFGSMEPQGKKDWSLGIQSIILVVKICMEKIDHSQLIIHFNVESNHLQRKIQVYQFLIIYCDISMFFSHDFQTLVEL